MEKISDNPEIQAHYELMIRNGESHRFAEMMALGQTPYCTSDNRRLLHGHRDGDEFGDPRVSARYRQIAEEHGQNPVGKKYLSQLARFPGDPEAWVSDASDVRRICEERNYACEGAVNVPLPRPDAPPVPDVPVADDLVDHYAEREIENDPALAEKPVEEVKEMIKDRLTGTHVKH